MPILRHAFKMCFKTESIRIIYYVASNVVTIFLLCVSFKSILRVNNESVLFRIELCDKSYFAFLRNRMRRSCLFGSFGLYNCTTNYLIFLNLNAKTVVGIISLTDELLFYFIYFVFYFILYESFLEFYLLFVYYLTKFLSKTCSLHINYTVQWTMVIENSNNLYQQRIELLAEFP